MRKKQPPSWWTNIPERRARLYREVDPTTHHILSYNGFVWSYQGEIPSKEGAIAAAQALTSDAPAVVVEIPKGVIVFEKGMHAGIPSPPYRQMKGAKTPI
jgi:hypothetical protein